MRIFWFSLIAVVFAGIGTVRAQMTDDQIIEYVNRGIAAGKNEQQIGRELLSRGVRVGQLQQLKSRLMNDAGRGGALPQTTDPASRLRTDEGSDTHTGAAASMAAAAPAIVEDPMNTAVESVAELGGVKEIYGHRIFNSPALSFEPNENIPTPDSYKLGPGDEVIVDIWGSNETSLRYTISPEGDVMMSQIGPVYLAGLTVREAENKIRKVLERKYEGVMGDEPSSDIRVSLGKLRTMRVNIMGEVATPGTYRVSGFATLFHALYNAGGITPIGSLRDIKVVRNGKTIASVDVYEYLFEGKSTVDIRLQEDDVIIVPPYKILAEVSGEMKRPMYYELKPDETVADLVGYAGGFTGGAYTAELQIVRGTGRQHTMLTVPESNYASTKLENGDVVRAGSILGRFDNRVEIDGAVYRAGAYELGDRVWTVGGLVAAADGVRDDAFLTRALLTRKRDDYTLETIAVDLDGILKGRVADISLRPDDVLYVPSAYSLAEHGELIIGGMVANPGSYIFAENTTLEDLVLRAGGLLDGASEVRIEVSRRRKDPSSTTETRSLVETFLLDMKDGYVVDGKEKFMLEPFDVVNVRRSPAYQIQRNVRVEGEVLFAGDYSLSHKNERLSDLVSRAGGITMDAYARGARLIRTMNDDEKATRDAMVRMAERNGGRDSVAMSLLNLSDVYTVGIELDKALENPGSDYDMVLREGDRLVIPENVSTVSIDGAVMYPNTVLYQGGRKLKYYISNAGGYGGRAKRSRVYIIYMNGTVAKVKRCKSASMIEPGCEIVVPSKPERNGVKLSEVLSISTTAVSMGLMATSIANLARRW